MCGHFQKNKNENILHKIRSFLYIRNGAQLERDFGCAIICGIWNQPTDLKLSGLYVYDDVN